MSSTDTPVVAAAVAHRLAHSNLLQVFSNRDSGSRMEAIRQTYHEDVVFYEPDKAITGHDGIANTVQALLDQRPGWEFVPDGPPKLNHEMVYLAWKFGPLQNGMVDGKMTGADVMIVRDDKIQKFWVVLNGVSDVKA